MSPGQSDAEMATITTTAYNNDNSTNGGSFARS